MLFTCHSRPCLVSDFASSDSSLLAQHGVDDGIDIADVDLAVMIEIA